MLLYGFFNGVEWLMNDFQFPHFESIYDLIAAYGWSIEMFTAQHGAPENWEKREISIDDIMAILAG